MYNPVLLFVVKMPYIKKTSGKRAPAKRKLAEEFAPGEVLTDTSKKEWKLGMHIGQGGFGRLYLGKLVCTKQSILKLRVLKASSPSSFPHPNNS